MIRRRKSSVERVGIGHPPLYGLFYLYRMLWILELVVQHEDPIGDCSSPVTMSKLKVVSREDGARSQ